MFSAQARQPSSEQKGAGLEDYIERAGLNQVVSIHKKIVSHTHTQTMKLVCVIKLKLEKVFSLWPFVLLCMCRWERGEEGVHQYRWERGEEGVHQYRWERGEEGVHQ